VSGGLYPVMLDVSRLPATIVGGGAVATRKAAGLVEAGGRPEIVAPEVTEALRGLIDAHGLAWIRRPYATGDLARCRLAFAATDDAAVNARVAEDAATLRIPFSRADEGAESDFHVPSHLREGDVVVAVSTGGAAPLLARRLRERLAARAVTPGLGRTARRLAALRAQVQSRWPGDEARRRAFWFELITPEFLDLAVAGRDEDVEQAIGRCLSQS
jgi:precorrin-2 dehydrogenase/sirohydrochlorin ferrochelatase